ncbi:MAG: hypothetical protein U1E16_08485 [Hyphomicrobiales bacterium]
MRITMRMLPGGPVPIYGSIQKASDSMSSRYRNAPGLIIQLRVLKMIAELPSPPRRLSPAASRKHQEACRRAMCGNQETPSFHHARA